MKTKLALIILTTFAMLMQAFAQGIHQDSWVYFVIKNDDQVGKILENHGNRPLWGRGNAVEEFYRLNPELSSTQDRRLKVGTRVRIPLRVVAKDHTEPPLIKSKRKDEVTREISSVWTSLHPDFEFGVTPMYIGNSQKLKSTGLNFDASFYAFSNFYLKMGLIPSSNLKAELGLKYVSATVNSRNIDAYRIKESHSSYLASEVKVKYCGFYNKDENKICPKFSLLVDSFYILNFSSNTELVLQRLEDMYLTYGIDWEHFFTESKSSGFLGIRYDHGLQRGQNITVDWKSNRRLIFESGLRWPVMNEKSEMTLSSRVASHQAEFEINQDDWSLKSTSFELSVGFRF